MLPPLPASPHPPSQQPCPAKFLLPHSPCWGCTSPQPTPLVSPQLGCVDYTDITGELAQFWPNLATTQVRNAPSVGDGPIESRMALAPAGLVPNKQGHGASGSISVCATPAWVFVVARSSVTFRSHLCCPSPLAAYASQGREAFKYVFTS